METKVIREVVFIAPQAVRLGEPESFVIDGRLYTVKPDVTGKVSGGKAGQYWFRLSNGFAGRKFVIDTFDGRHIVTHNIWMGEETDAPDTACFDGPAAKPVRLRREERFTKGGENG